jgi:hypothetical protein
VASGTGRGGNAVELGQDVRAYTIREGDIKRVRQAVFGVAVEHDAICEAGMQRLPEVFAQAAHAIHWSEIACELACGPECDGKQRTFGAGTAAGFVIGSVNEGFKRRSTPDVESADSLGSIELVPCHREQIDAEGVYVGCDLADGLGSVDVLARRQAIRDSIQAIERNMRRREFIAMLSSAAAAWPLGARAQQPTKLPTIGYLGTAVPSAWSPWTAAFVQRLRELDWIEGRTVAIEYRWAEGRVERYGEIAAEFVRLKVDVIVTVGTAAAAARQATSVIPIVFAVAADPVGSGVVASLARPSGSAQSALK